MNEAVIIVSTLAVCFSAIALICSCVAIALVAGFTRSTHTVQFKPLGLPGETQEIKDPLADLLDEEKVEENPFKRKKRNWDLETGKPIDTETEQKEFMDDVTDANNF